jgi:hypothetical protein
MRFPPLGLASEGAQPHAPRTRSRRLRMGVEGKKVAFYVPRFCRAMRATLEEERLVGAAESPHVVDAPR